MKPIQGLLWAKVYRPLRTVPTDPEKLYFVEQPVVACWCVTHIAIGLSVAKHIN